MPDNPFWRSNDIVEETSWHLIWKPLTLVAQPFGQLTVEILLSKDLTAPLPPVAAAVAVTIRLATEADLGWINQLYRDEPYLYLGDENSSNGSYRSRLQRGEKCFLAFVDSQIAHMNWLCFSWGEEPVPGHRILLRPGEAYTTDALTLKTFRGKNIHAVVLGEMLRAAQLARCFRAYTVARIDRRASFAAFRQLEWRVHGRLLCFVPRHGGKPQLLRLSGSIEPLLRSRTAA